MLLHLIFFEYLVLYPLFEKQNIFVYTFIPVHKVVSQSPEA